MSVLTINNIIDFKNHNSKIKEIRIHKNLMTVIDSTKDFWLQQITKYYDWNRLICSNTILNKTNYYIYEVTFKEN